MSSILREAPRVRDAKLNSTLNAYYVAPDSSILRDPSNSLIGLTHVNYPRSSKETSLPLSLLSSLANVFDKPVEDDGPGLRRIILPTPPVKDLARQKSPGSRNRRRQTAIVASAAAAAVQTLQRQHELQRQQATAPPSRLRARAGRSFESWQPPYLRTDSTVSTVAPAASRQAATVKSPHAPSRSAQPTPPQASPPAETKGPSTAKLAWRLRRRSGATTSAPTPSSSPSPVANLVVRRKSPLELLRHLGSATFNDAPLHTILSSLDLRLPSSRSSTTTPGNNNHNNNSGSGDPCTREPGADQTRWHTIRDNDRRRRRSSRQRMDTVNIHLGDVEARTFRVEVVAGEASPLQSLLDVYPGCPWDGSEFFLLPLEDERRVPLDALPPHLAEALATRLRDDESVPLTGEQTASQSNGRESPTGLDFAGMPTNFLRAANSSLEPANVSCSDEGKVAGWSLPPSASSPAMSAGAAAAVASQQVVPDGPVFGRALEGPDADGNDLNSVVPSWKRFSTTAALYLALGEAGCCDVAYFPYAGVQLCAWADLVAQQQTRIEMLASCSAAAINRLHAARCSKKADSIPVAILFPTTRKGVMRRPLSLTTQPFTDAEVFQLFYLQLVFRAYFDVRLPGLGFRLRGGRSEWQLRSDLVAVRSSGNHGVAFEHPFDANRWVHFPPHTRLLTLLGLEEAVVPLFATPAELQDTAALPLFGSGDSLPCIGSVGHALVRWAATVEVSSPATAMAALAKLFEVVDVHFGTSRVDLWNSFCACGDGASTSKPALLFRCGATSVGAALHRSGGTLTRFFVSAERRGVFRTLTDTTATLRDTHTSDEASTTLSNTTRQTHLPCVPRESSMANTTLPSAEATPHQPALNDVVLELDASVAMHGSTGDAFASTINGMPNLNQSRTNAFVSTFDVVHLSAVRVPDDADAAEVSKLLCASSLLPAPAAAEDAAVVTSCGSASHLVDVPPSATKGSQRPCDAEANPLLSLPAEALKLAESHASAGEAVSDAVASSVVAPLQNASFVGLSSPFTKQESLVTRWRYYMQSGNCAIFDGATAGIQVFNFLGRGGSGLVYRGTYGSRRLPVAVKVLIIPDGMSHEHYVRESLTDVAFYVLANQLNDYGISYNGRAHDFIVSSVAPEGLPETDADEARRGGDPATTKLCYFITDLMDGTLGRFLDSNDDDFDPMYDQLLNSPLQEGELFQFLFNQLAFKTLFDWRVLDVMLNNQLRGDNVGFRYVSLPPEQALHLREHPTEAASLAQARQYYAGILYAFQFSAEEEVRYLRFPAQKASSAEDAAGGSSSFGKDDIPLRLICMIDVGQGMQPNVAELVRNEYIGETVVASCIEDDGFGRFWPLDELYCRYVDVKGPLSKEVVAWGSQQRIATQEDAFRALQELFVHFYPAYGVSAPSEEELSTYLCLSWTPANVASLKEAYVYRA